MGNASALLANLANFTSKTKLDNKLLAYLLYLHFGKTRCKTHSDWSATCLSLADMLHLAGFLTILTGGCL